MQGRDSTRNIQRGIAAEELRKQLPRLVDSVMAALEEFRDFTGRVFIFDDKDYQVSTLNCDPHDLD